MSTSSWRHATHPRSLLVIGAIVLVLNLPILHYAFFRRAAPVTAQVPWSDDFSDGNKLAQHYWSPGGQWRIVNGELLEPGVKSNPLWLQATLPHDVAVDVDVRALGPEADMRVEIFGSGVECGSGYQLIHGAINNGFSAISRFGYAGTPTLQERLSEARKKGSSASNLDQLAKEGLFRPNHGVRLDVNAPRVEVNRKYHYRVERVGAELRWYIDGVLVGQFVDPYPLEGRGNDRVGLSGWEASVMFDNLVVTPISSFGAAAPPPAPVPAGPFKDDFERAAPGDAYSSLAISNVGIFEGKLRVQQMRNRPLWLKAPLPDDARISFSARSLSPEGDIKIEAWGDGQSAYTGDPRLQYTATGYVFILGGWRNTTSVIARQHEHTPDRRERSDLRIEPNRWYRWVIERRGGKLTWTIDGQPFLEMNDANPLTGPNNRFFAFSGWDTAVEFDDLSVEPL